MTNHTRASLQVPHQESSFTLFISLTAIPCPSVTDPVLVLCRLNEPEHMDHSNKLIYPYVQVAGACPTSAKQMLFAFLSVPEQYQIHEAGSVPVRGRLVTWFFFRISCIAIGPINVQSTNRHYINQPTVICGDAVGRINCGFRVIRLLFDYLGIIELFDYLVTLSRGHVTFSEFFVHPTKWPINQASICGAYRYIVV